MQPTFLDFEASSLSLIDSYPIEVGICSPEKPPESWLIRPHPLWQDWSESAERIHGIDRQTLCEQGLSVSQIAKLLNQRLSGTVYCDAWTFDSFWLHRLYKAANTRPTFSLESIATLLNDDQVRRWKEARNEIIATCQVGTHRAANDAFILQLTWQAIHSDTEKYCKFPPLD